MLRERFEHQGQDQVANSVLKFLILLIIKPKKCKSPKSNKFLTCIKLICNDKINAIIH